MSQTFLMIESPDEAPIAGFTIIGASSKRGCGNDNIIGQFGSGSKLALATLLRMNVYPTIYSGLHCLEFGLTEERRDGDISYRQIFIKHSGKEDGKQISRTEHLQITPEYGIMDWTNAGMPLREFVSNAIDATIVYNERHHNETQYPWDGVKVCLVDKNQMRAKRGMTRIFVPVEHEEVFGFYKNLNKWFLHFEEPELVRQTILDKNNRHLGEVECSVIYRKGVRVREISRVEGLFDYNLSNLEIDEARNCSDYNVKWAVEAEFGKATTDQIAKFFVSFINKNDFWEKRFEYYSMVHNVKANEVNWREALDRVGTNVVLTTGNQMDLVTQKGYRPLVMPENMLQCFEKTIVRCAKNILTEDQRLGREICDPTPDTIAALDWCWEQISAANMTSAKEKPPIKCFQNIMDGGSVVAGFHRDGVVYVNYDIASGTSVELRQTVLEELSHYLTGSGDLSRDLQDWAFKFAVRIAMKETNKRYMARLTTAPLELPHER